MNFKRYFSLILVVSMLFSVLNVQIATASSGSTDYAWLEAENATPDTGVGFGSISGEAGTTYQTLSGLKALRVASGTNTGIGIDFDFSVKTAQSYDIFVHGTYEVNSSYMSTVNMFVDGNASQVTNLISEGWIIKGSSNYNFQVGWQKVTKELASGDHTFRWQIDGMGSSATTNKALCDVVIVVPTSAGFVPEALETVDSAFPVANVANYELCTLLEGVNLTNLEQSLILPGTSAGGYAVSWSTSDATVIGADGKIKPSNKVKSATLTATITADGVGYTRNFPVSVAAVITDYVWMEAESGKPDTGVGFGSISGAVGTTYQTLSGLKALRVASGTNTGIGIDFDFSVKTAQSYDIFVHGTYEANSSWMSTVNMFVDQTQRSVTNLISEGWIIKGSSNYNFQVGWQKVTADLTSGDHTFRWQIDGMGSSATTNKALCDVVIVVPTSAGFAPTRLDTVDSLFPVKNAMDYELCTLLTGTSLTNLEEDITLPELTAGGYEVTWTTSNASVIGADGKINPSNKAQNATLTATITADSVSYTKDFAVTVAAEVVEITDYVWMEAESGKPDTGVGFGSISGAVGTTYQTLSGLKALRVASGTNTGIGIDFDFSVKTAQSYDIFVHGTYEPNSSYMSTVNMFVDGTASQVTNLISEGWIIKGSSNYNFQVGWQKVTKELASGDHTFRWQVDGKGSSATTNKALCDVVIVVPTSAGFNPTRLDTVDSLFPVKNAMDFELCSILTGVNLTNLETDLDLPTTTVGGYEVTWKTSDASVITADGKITPSVNAKSATLTASITANSVTYTKDFVVSLEGEGSDYSWIEAKDMACGGGSSLGLMNEPTAGTGVSGVDYLRVNAGTAPTDSNGYYADSAFTVKTAGTYDIFVRGSWYSYSTDYASPVEFSVDGKTCADVSVMNYEEWINPNASGSTTWPMGWQRATVDLTKGSHTFRWAIKSVNEKESKYRGILDAIVIVPSGCGFVPTPVESATDAFPAKNVSDYQACSNGEGTINVSFPYTIEAESYADTNWKNSGGNVVLGSDTMRGGKYVTLYNDPAEDTEYYLEYQVQAPISGYYSLDVASTPPQNSGWSSKIYARVNAGEVFALNADAAPESESSLTLYNADAVYLRKGLNSIRLIVKDRLDTGLYVCRIDYFTLKTADVSLSGIYADVPFMVFESDKDVVPYVQANGFVPADVTVSYVVTDYRGNTIKSGDAVIPKGARRGNINLGKLANGYYKITATYSGQTVTNDISVVVPEASRKEYQDTPFAIDVNFYSLYNKYAENKDLLSEYVGALNRLGVSWIRDRLTLEDATLSDTGEISVNMAKNNNIGSIVKNNSDIKISTVVNGLPSWIESDYSKFGTDYNLTYRLFKALGDAIGDNVDAFELLNETDNGGGSAYDDMGADVYASFAKAATVGIKDSGSNAFVITQGNARYPDNHGKYSEILYDNGLFDYVSADNYHSHVLVDEEYSELYTAFSGMNGNKMVDALKKQYDSSVPVWITEAGYLLENVAGEELNSGEIDRQAKYLVTSTVESLATGVDKHFYFLGTVYDETNATTGINYTTGIMNKNKKYPAFYPAYSAMSAMTYVLGEGQYLGKISNNGVSAYAFEDGSDTVLVLYSEGAAKDYSVQLDCDSATKYDIFANSEVLSSNNGAFTVSVSSEPIYLKFSGNISSELDASYADELITISDRTLTEADKVIISQEYSSGSKESARNSGYYINNYNKTVTVTVTNLNPTAKNVTVDGAATNGWSVSPASQTVSVDAYGTATLTFTINIDGGSYDSKISFAGTVDGVKTSASTAYAYGGFAGIEFVNVDGSKLYEFDENAKNYARVTLNNKNSLDSKSVKVYVASYDEEQKLLIDMFATDMSVPLLQSASKDIELKYVEGASVYKVFVWDENLNPYAGVYKLQAELN